MKHTTSQKMFQYWNDLRDTKELPDREAVEPTSLKSILKDTFILQIQPGGRAKFRLAGTNLCKTYCRELKEQGFCSLWEEENSLPIRTLIRSVGEDNAACVLGVEGKTLESDRKVAIEILLLPLLLNGYKNKRIIGTHATFSDPYWLGSQPILNYNINSVRIIMPDDIQNLLNRTSALKIPQVPIFKTQGLLRRYKHLSVIDGGIQ